MRADQFKSFLVELVPAVLAVAIGISVGLCWTTLAGESPLHVLKILVHSAFGSRYDLGMTLFYSVPLIFTGLSVALAYQAGLFNIGAEGQLTLGALGAVIAGIYLPHLPRFLALPAGAAAAFLFGGIWGLIPGWLLAKRGSHEVITTIMLNFISSGVVSWFILNPLKNPDSQNSETQAVGAQYLLHRFSWFEGAPVGMAVFLALGCVVCVWFLLRKTVLGFELRATGQNPVAAKFSGISVPRSQILSLFLAGGLAGLAGVAEVFGNAGRFKLGFSPGYGFIGIAVALLVEGNPFGVVVSAFLFGALHKGSADLDLETENVNQSLSQILQAFVILMVSAKSIFRAKFLKKGAA